MHQPTCFSTEFLSENMVQKKRIKEKNKLELNITPKLAKTGKKDEIEKMGQIE